MKMTNRDRLLNMSLYDLIMSLDYGGFMIVDGAARYCRLSMLTHTIDKSVCSGDCSECIQRYLNEEVK